MIARVFEFYIENNVKLKDGIWPNDDFMSPLKLGAVCRIWRNITWSWPRIWTHIHIFLRPGASASCIEVAREWLSRSGQLPLSVYAVCQPTRHRDTIDPEGIYCSIISVLNEYSHRWEDLRIICSSSALLPIFRGNSQGAPLLRNLWLTVNGSLREHSSKSANQSFRMTCMKPRPSVVYLSRIQFRLLEIDWSRVTSIHTSDPGFRVDECVQLFRQAPQLVECTILPLRDQQQTDLDLDQIPVGQSVIYHGLQSFTVSCHGVDVEPFLSRFAFPNLTYLSLPNVVGINGGTFWDCIIDVIIRSSARITHLDLSEDACTYIAFSRFLDVTPFLHELQVRISGIGNDLFRHLANTSSSITSRSSNSLLLPNLQSIYYEGHVAWDASFWALIPQAIKPYHENGNLEIRPLKKISIISRGTGHPAKYRSAICEDRNLVCSLVKLSKSGISLDLRYNKVDILEKSAQHHRIRTG